MVTACAPRAQLSGADPVPCAEQDGSFARGLWSTIERLENILYCLSISINEVSSGMGEEI